MTVLSLFKLTTSPATGAVHPRRAAACSMKNARRAKATAVTESCMVRGAYSHEPNVSGLAQSTAERAAHVCPTRPIYVSTSIQLNFYPTYYAAPLLS
ncbi:hypothetical protein C8T65DRAFT_657346 [Cerioporus squamosus]|nr:hypothetical protein C8T65DRAFT_657346 [Cerioporus squamosus]